MDLSFDINTQEGGKIIVSLPSSYPAFPGIASGFELIEVIVLKSESHRLEMFADLLVRDRYLHLVEMLRNEVVGDFETISEQK